MTEKASVGVGLLNPKSPTNVGAIMRAAGCFGANYVLYTGQRYSKAAKFQTDTKQASQHIPLLGVEDVVAAAKEKAGTKLICVDLIEGAVALPDFEHPDHALYVFGPEDGTIPQSVIDAADAAVYIPTSGCLNLAATVNVVLYDRQAKKLNVHDNDETIRKNRDVNNRVLFKR